MKYLIQIGSLILALGMLNGASAQETLSLEDAVRESLNNNYGIQIARLDVETSQNSAHLGATGALPTVSANVGANANYNRDAFLTFNLPLIVDGVEIREIDAAPFWTYGYNGTVSASYNLSLGSFTNFKVLNTSVNQSKESLQLTMEQTISQVSNAYYALARLVEGAQLQKESLDQSVERLNYVKRQAEFGQATSVAILNAQVDVNTDSINLAQSQVNIENARRDLNFLLGKEMESVYEVNTDFDLLGMLSLEALQNSALSSNSSLTIADYARKVSRLNLKSAKQAALPTLSLSGNYNYNFSDNGPFQQVGTVRSDGLGLNGSIAIPIFNGNQVRRNIQNAEIAIASSQNSYKQAEQQVLRDVNKAYATYLNARKILALNQKSLEASQANFDRTKELFELGQSSSVLFREAQLNLLRVKYNLRSLLYDIKTSEVELMRLSGQLVGSGS